MPITIILGANHDHHAQHMLQACQAEGQQALLFDTANYPAHHCIGWIPDAAEGFLELDAGIIPFRHISAVFWCSLSPCKVGPRQDHPQSAMALNDATSVLRTFLEEDSIRWINSWQVFQFHRVKPRQLSLAAKLGARIPNTYVGNQAKQIKAFCHANPEAIFKPVYGGAQTAFVSPDLLEQAHLQQVLKISPVTIQAYIPGTDVRTYVIGQHVYSAEIVSSQVDFRTDEDTEVKAINLPKEITSLARHITQKFGMAWTAIDWRRNQRGHYYFLEANPSPMFIHFERQTGFPITQDLASLLAV